MKPKRCCSHHTPSSAANKSGVPTRLVEILHEGAELDAINRLVSAEQGKAAVDELMEKTRSFLQGTESSSAQLEKWLDRFIEDSDR